MPGRCACNGWNDDGRATGGAAAGEVAPLPGTTAMGGLAMVLAARTGTRPQVVHPALLAAWVVSADGGYQATRRKDYTNY